MEQQTEMSHYENAAKRIHLDRSISKTDDSTYDNNDDNLSDNDSKSLSSLSSDDHNLISSDENDENLTEYSSDCQSEGEKEEIENTRLHMAVINEDIELVKEILSTGVDIDAPNKENKTALHLAVYNKNLPIIECLLEYGASVFALNKSYDRSLRWETPFHIAVRGDRLDIVKLLLTTQIDVNKLMKNYNTVWKFAYRHRNYKLIKSRTGCPSYIENITLMKTALNTFPIEELLQTDYNEDLIAPMFGKYFDINLLDSDGQTALFQAVQNKSTDMVEYLLDNGADVNPKNRFKSRGHWTALHIAVKIKEENMVQCLINHENCDLIAQTYYYTPLDVATFTNNSTIVKMLAGKIAQHDVYGKNINNHVLSSFHEAIDRNFMEITKYYLDTFNPDLNIKSEIGLSPLEIAAGDHSLEMLKLLLDCGAEISYSLKERYEEVNKGTSVLFSAVENATVTMLDLIFSRGTQIDSFNKTKNGVTILQVAVLSKNTDIVERLLDRGVDINSKCKIDDTYEEITPLLYGVRRNLYETFLLLIVKGANLNDIAKVNSKRISIIDIAIKERCGDDFLMMLLNSGADINISSIADRRLPETTAMVVEQHLLKLRAAKLFVHHKFRRWVSRGKAKKVFYIKCKKEVLKMEEEIINESTICYYNLLIKRVDQVAMFAGNKDIVEDLEFGKLKAKFPLYAEMLLCNFKRGQRRHQLLKEAEKMLRDIFINLPDDCVRKILMYLNSNDLLRCTGKITDEIVN